MVAFSSCTSLVLPLPLLLLSSNDGLERLV
jgi:hypothetical protein